MYICRKVFKENSVNLKIEKKIFQIARIIVDFRFDYNIIKPIVLLGIKKEVKI